MNALTLRVLADIEQGRVFLDGNGNVQVTSDTVIEPHDQTAYIHTVRDLRASSWVMDDWRAGEGTVRRLRLTTLGDLKRIGDEYASPTALVFTKGAFEAVAR